MDIYAVKITPTGSLKIFTCARGEANHAAKTTSDAKLQDDLKQVKKEA
jgi:hypothetical protein